MTDGVHLLALAGVLFGAVAQSATGMGFSLLAAPALVLYLGPQQGVATTVVLATLSSALPFLRDGRHARPREVLRLLVPTLLCTPLIALALRGVDTRWLAPAAGAGVVVGVCVLASGVRWKWLRRPQGAVAAGAASALLNVVGGVGGPPIGLYAAHADWEPAVTRGNLHSFFIVQNCATALAVGIALPGPSELVALALGTACGMLLAPRVPTKTLRTAVLAVSLLGGIGLVGGAV
ncbi:TSUP family transporter [Streptomyces sp. NPDC052052]|uniref:sulfite exporter TauE/SafE family protein n=1 Tax=Streptomyces sp. NPDC052052 TaxID=3154756 RepID=UPI003412B0B5